MKQQWCAGNCSAGMWGCGAFFDSNVQEVSLDGVGPSKVSYVQFCSGPLYIHIATGAAFQHKTIQRGVVFFLIKGKAEDDSRREATLKKPTRGEGK